MPHEAMAGKPRKKASSRSQPGPQTEGPAPLHFSRWRLPCSTSAIFTIGAKMGAILTLCKTVSRLPFPATQPCIMTLRMLKSRFTFFKLFCLTLLAALLSGCASGPSQQALYSSKEMYKMGNVQRSLAGFESAYQQQKEKDTPYYLEKGTLTAPAGAGKGAARPERKFTGAPGSR